jgi:predicted dehydrogenase
MEISDDQGHGINVIYSGPTGQLVVDELAGTMHLWVREEQHRSLPTTRYGMPGPRTERRIQPADAVAPTRAVLEALLGGRDIPTGADGRLAVATLVAAYVSDESGHRAVGIDSGLPEGRAFPWA